MEKGWLYLAGGIDLYFCRKTGWAMAESVTAELVRVALTTALHGANGCLNPKEFEAQQAA